MNSVLGGLFLVVFLNIPNSKGSRNEMKRCASQIREPGFQSPRIFLHLQKSLLIGLMRYKKRLTASEFIN